MIKKELYHVLRNGRDPADAQFRKNLEILVERATHEALTSKTFTLPNKDQQAICTTVLWAYYRSIYTSKGNFGGVIIVIPDPTCLLWLGNLLKGVIGLRDVEATDLDARRMCPVLRDNKDAAGYSKCRIIRGLPFDSMMSWDISNLAACCDLSESIVLTPTNPATWGVTATKKGDVVRLEDLMGEVFDIKAAVAEFKRA